jgi:hypothetical protein
VLGDVADPSSLVQPLYEAAAAAAATAVISQAGQPLYQTVGEPRQCIGRKVLQHSKINDELNGWFIVPDVWTPKDSTRNDLEIWGWSRGNALGHKRSSQNLFAVILPLMAWAVIC